MTERRFGPRIAALLAGGAFALHQLRYLLGYGADSHGQLGHQGHAYMTVLAPVVAVALMLVIADFGARLLGGGPKTDPARPAPGLRRLWLLATLSLLSAYALQESLEGALAPGHPDGAGALLGHGGWAALPLAVALGLAIALLARGAQGALELVAEPAVRVRTARPALSLTLAASRARPRTRRPVRRATARAPPLPITP